MISGRADQADLAGRLWDVAARQESGHRVPTHEDCDLIVEILKGRSLPQRALLAEADERESRADRLTIEQATILGVTRLINRVEVRGGAGSGKTVLALTQAKELHPRRARDAGPAGRAALLLRRARQLVQALHGHGRPEAPPGVRRHLRGARGLPGCDRVRRARRHRLLGEPAARRDGRARR